MYRGNYKEFRIPAWARYSSTIMGVQWLLSKGKNPRSIPKSEVLKYLKEHPGFHINTRTALTKKQVVNGKVTEPYWTVEGVEVPYKGITKKQALGIACYITSRLEHRGVPKLCHNNYF